MDLEKLQKAVDESNSITDLYRKYYNKGKPNSRTHGKFKQLVLDSGIDISHFTKNGTRPKYKMVEKVCPVCGGSFPLKMIQKRK